jgi:uncharacterized phage-associated protein
MKNLINSHSGELWEDNYCIFDILSEEEIHRMNDPFNQEHIKATVLYVLSQTGTITKKVLLKLIYFADRKHLAKYGRTIFDDVYIKMPQGPVLSITYDLIKDVEKDRRKSTLVNHIKVKGWDVIPLDSPNLDWLSKSEIGCLEDSIKENLNKPAYQLTKESHDYAWRKADLNKRLNFLDIAIAEGAEGEILDYIQDNLDDKNLTIG